MEPKAIKEALKRIAAPFGERASGLISISSGYSDKEGEVGATISYSIGHEYKYIRVVERSIEAAIKALDAKAIGTVLALHAEVVRKMALAIINATADAGSCNAASLRLAGFEDGQIETFGATACAEANQVASNGPFSIEDGLPVLANDGGDE